MPKVGLLIFPFWTPHFCVWTPHFGWTLKLYCSVNNSTLKTQRSQVDSLDLSDAPITFYSASILWTRTLAGEREQIGAVWHGRSPVATRRSARSTAGCCSVVMLRYHFSISITDTIFTTYRGIDIDIDIDIDFKYVSKMHTFCRLKF